MNRRRFLMASTALLAPGTAFAEICPTESGFIDDGLERLGVALAKDGVKRGVVLAGMAVGAAFALPAFGFGAGATTLAVAGLGVASAWPVIKRHAGSSFELLKASMDEAIGND